MRLTARLDKLEVAWHIGTRRTTRLIWVAVREVIGARAEHESFWSLLRFEWNGRTCRPQGVSEQLLDTWSAQGDLVILFVDPIHCADFDLPFKSWPSSELIRECIDKGQLIEWRDFKPGMLWAAYCELRGIENLYQRTVER